MNSFAPIFETILDSSVWEEPYQLRVLWTALLVLKGPDHVVRSSAFKIAKRANMKEQEVIDGLRVLSMPDKRRIEHQDFEGRRIQKVEDGWLILNGQKYEDEMRAVSRRMYKARKAREARQRAKAVEEARKNGPLPGETAAGRAPDQKTEDAITAAALPDAAKALPVPAPVRPVASAPSVKPRVVTSSDAVRKTSGQLRYEEAARKAAEEAAARDAAAARLAAGPPDDGPTEDEPAVEPGDDTPADEPTNPFGGWKEEA